MNFSLDEEDAYGRKVFTFIVKQVETAFSEIAPFFQNLDVTIPVKDDFLSKGQYMNLLELRMVLW